MTGETLEAPRFVTVGAGATERRVAWRKVEGRAPTVVWLGGFRSDMRGTKAERLDRFARETGLGFVRLDYSGHGESSGAFRDGTISRWRDDAAAAIQAATAGPVVLVGSSMGAWIALLLAPRLAGRLAGMLLLAPAPDFTERLVLPKLTDAQKRELDANGFVSEPSSYSDEPTVYTKALLVDGARNLVMRGPIAVGCPVHVVQGMADAEVPYAHALDLVAHLPGDGVSLTLVPNGDHRLSREEDLSRMERAVRDLALSA